MTPSKLKTLDGEKRSVRLAAVCAAVCCCLLYGWFVLSVPYGFGVPDEAFYLTIPQRLLLGDRMLLEEWHLSQFTAVFQLLPYAVFTKLTGGTEGIVLCMRYVYLAMSFTSFWYIFIKLRKTPWRALLCAFCFCAFVPFAVFAPNYYTIPIFLLLISCFTFCSDATCPSRVHLFFAGVLFAGAVLITPALTLAYLFYSILALVYFIAQKKGRLWLADWSFILNVRVWLFFFFGVLVSAVAFTTYLQLTSGFGEIIKNLPNLLSDSEYDVSANGNVRGFLLQKIEILFSYFGPTCVLFPLAAAASEATMRITVFKKRARSLRPLLASVNFAVFLYAVLLLLFNQNGTPLSLHCIMSVPLFCFGAGCYILCENKNRKLFLLWWCGLFFSLAKDMLSDVSVGFGCILGTIPAVWHLLQLISVVFVNLYKEPEKRGSWANKAKKRKRLRDIGKAEACCILAVVCIWNCYIAFSEGWEKPYVDTHPFASGIVKVETGPYRGLHFSEDIYTVYEGMVCDLSQIAETERGPVYVSALAPWCYLYTGGTNPAYSTWWIKEDAAARQIAYWRQYPEKLPAVIYVPDYAYRFEAAAYNGAPVEQLRPYCRWEKHKGTAGTIYLITDWML